MLSRDRIQLLVVIVSLVGSAPCPAGAAPPEAHISDLAGLTESWMEKQSTPQEHFPARDLRGGAADTSWFGYYRIVDGDPYAVWGEVWSFDHPDAVSDLEGWESVSIYSERNRPEDPIWNRVTPADFECPAQAPMIDGGQGQFWAGRQQSTADAECWLCDAGATCSLGYPDVMCQILRSPEIAYSGGDVEVEFRYFVDTEACCDGVLARIVAVPSEEIIGIGIFSGDSGGPDNPVLHSSTVSAAELPGGTTAVRLVAQFVSDQSFSDTDGNYCSTFGGFGLDDVIVNIGGGLEASYDFDSDDEGWTVEICAGFDPLAGVHDTDDYELPDGCIFSGAVLGFHDMDQQHPEGVRWEQATSPIVDLSAFPSPIEDIVASYDVYLDIPTATNDTRWRSGWSYYPYVCPGTGEVSWSPRVGPFAATGGVLTQCESRLASGLPWIPAGAEEVRFVLDVFNFGLGIDSNATPLFDNIRVGVVSALPPSDAPETGLEGPFAFTIGQNPVVRGTGTDISFRLESSQPVRLEIVDVQGRRVAELQDGLLPTGRHRLSWDATDDAGRAAAAGLYFVRLRAGDQQFSEKVVVVD